MKKRICLLLAILLVVTGCGKIPTLENGKEAVVTFKNGDKISVDDLYAKENEGFLKLVDANCIKNDKSLKKLISPITYTNPATAQPVSAPRRSGSCPKKPLRYLE